jgi:hypothetical protein
MNYIPNPKALGWRIRLTNAYQTLTLWSKHLRQKLFNKARLVRKSNKFNGVLLLLIALAMLLSMLFSISLIISVGFMLFLINAGWYGLSGLFTKKTARSYPNR